VPVLGELLPGVQDVARSWAAWCKDVAASVMKWRGNREDSISSDAVGRERWRPVLVKLFEHMDTAAERVWSGFWQMQPTDVRRSIWNMLAPTGIFELGIASESVRLFKELTAMAVKFGTLLSPAWKELAHLNLMRDYMPRTTDAEFVGAIRDWVTGHKEHTLGGSSALFLAYLRRGVKMFLSTARPPGAYWHPLSVHEWLSDPGRWARSGTSSELRLEVVAKVDGAWVVKFARKSKWATACAMTLEQLERLFWTPAAQVNKALQKRELGKIRAVIAGDLANYLRQAYISYWLEECLREHQNTTLMYSTDQQVGLWYHMAATCAAETTKMPIDEREYDHYVTWEMLDVADISIDELIEDRYTDRRTKGELERALELTHESLRAGSVRVGDVKVPVAKGVLSGWRWTAFYDTLLNAGKVNAFRLYLLDTIGYDPVVSFCSQGDDVDLQLVSEAGAVAFWACYLESGFDVNPKKFFIDRKRDEYLRQVATATEVAGYPARAVPSLIFRNPVSRGVERGEERIREQVAGWVTAFSRMNNWVESLVVDDVARANNMTHTQVERVLHTPACVGGCGVPPLATSGWLGVTKGRVDAHWQWARLPPLAGIADAYGLPRAEVAAVWKDNVDPPAGTEKDAIPFELVETEPFDPTWQQVDARVQPVVARARMELPPSVASAMLERVKRASGREALDLEFKRWADPSCLPMYEYLASRCSRRLLKDWIAGRVPFVTPIIPGWSPLVVSRVYQYHAAAAWTNAINRSRVSYHRVLRSALRAELDTWLTLHTYRVRIAG
jgi:hypothetical protein